MTTSARKPTARSLFALTTLGVLSGLWALFQWGELVVARSGGHTFCSISETFNCEAIWDSPFANMVHGSTGIPVAGWGLIWSFIAFLLPLFALMKSAEGKTVASEWIAGVKITSAIGLISTLMLAFVSFRAGAVCIGCAGTYLLTFAYAVIVFVAWRDVGASGAYLKGAAIFGAA